MPNFIDYYEYSKLATAAYVDLTGLDGAAIAAAANTKERLPEALANQTFVATTTNPDVWAVPQNAYGNGFHGNDPFGFAATLFEKSGQKVLAIRGTEPSANGGQDLFQADLAGIGILGLAASQAVEIENNRGQTTVYNAH